MREACIPAANGHFSAKALAIMYDSFLESLGLSDGHTRRSCGDHRSRSGGGGVVGVNGENDNLLLSRAAVNEMRSYQVCSKLFVMVEEDEKEGQRGSGSGVVISHNNSIVPMLGLRS